MSQAYDHSEPPRPWYAVRTKPGAQLPQREYVVEPHVDSNGVTRKPRLVVSLNPNKSAVERALGDAGFACYMPAEKRLISDKRKPHVFKARRFPLLQGYVFVRGPCNFLKLQEVPGVAALVGINGLPLEIGILDILTMRSAEALAEQIFDEEPIRAQQAMQRRARIHGDRKMSALLKRLQVSGLTTVEIGKEFGGA